MNRKTQVSFSDLEVHAYLERIRYRGPVTPTTETLRDLHVAHLLTVPFENLSIHAGEPIVLDCAALFQKVVRRKRGGFCYELNGLFGELLRCLGFEVRMLSAEVMGTDGRFTREFDHMALLVSLEEDWLADVGFGDCIREPIRLNEHDERDRSQFRITGTSSGKFDLQRLRPGGAWETQYRFGLEPHALLEYEPMCRYHQTSRQSYFTQSRICSLATVSGRVTISGERLILTDGESRNERMIRDEAEYAGLLQQYFGIKM